MIEALLILVLGGIAATLGFTAFTLIPTGIVVLGYKKGQYWLVGACALLGVIAGAVASSVIFGLFVLLLLLPFSYAIMYCMTKYINFGRSVMVAIAAMILSLICIGLYLMTKTDIAEFIKNEVSWYIDEMGPQLMEQFKELGQEITLAELKAMTLESLYSMIAPLIIAFSLVMSLAVYSFAALIINKTAHINKNIYFIKFEYWNISPKVGCAMIISFIVVMMLAGFGLKQAETLMTVILTLLMIEYFFAGASTVYYLFKRKKVHGMVAFGIVLLLFSVFPGAMLFVGAIDKFFKIRYMLMHKDGVLKKHRFAVSGTGMHMNFDVSPEDDNASSTDPDAENKNEDEFDEEIDPMFSYGGDREDENDDDVKDAIDTDDTEDDGKNDKE